MIGCAYVRDVECTRPMC